MNTLSASRLMMRLGSAAVLSLAVVAGQAQTARPPGLKVVPQPVKPATSVTNVPNPAAMSSRFSAGLPSPNPNSAGLNSQLPAGLPPPINSQAGMPSANPPIDAGIETPQTNVMGAAGYGGGVAAGARAGAGAGAGASMGAGPITPLLLAQSFIGADLNRDGQLTRAEAQRLSIAPFAFEEMDANHDGVLTRSEYEDAVR